MDAANDFDGHPSDEVFRYAYLNSAFQTGLANALDEAISVFTTVANSWVKGRKILV